MTLYTLTASCPDQVGIIARFRLHRRKTAGLDSRIELHADATGRYFMRIEIKADRCPSCSPSSASASDRPSPNPLAWTGGSPTAR